jgi:hypothetical protein
LELPWWSMSVALINAVAEDAGFLSLCKDCDDVHALVRTLFRLHSNEFKTTGDLALWMAWNGPVMAAFHAAVGRAVLAFNNGVECVAHERFRVSAPKTKTKIKTTAYQLFCDDHRGLARRRVTMDALRNEEMHLREHPVSVSLELARMWASLDCVGRKFYRDCALSCM